MSDKIFVGIGCRTRGQVEVRDEVEVKGGDWGGGGGGTLIWFPLGSCDV